MSLGPPGTQSLGPGLEHDLSLDNKCESECFEAKIAASAVTIIGY